MMMLKNMMPQNRKKLVLINTILIFLISLFIYCKNNRTDSSQSSSKYLYNYKWEEGKKLFYQNCSFCHTPRIKDEIFKNFNPKNQKKELLIKILKNENHSVIQSDTLNKFQIKKLLKFIETPQKRQILD